MVKRSRYSAGVYLTRRVVCSTYFHCACVRVRRIARRVCVRCHDGSCVVAEKACRIRHLEDLRRKATSASKTWHAKTAHAITYINSSLVGGPLCPPQDQDLSQRQRKNVIRHEPVACFQVSPSNPLK